MKNTHYNSYFGPATIFVRHETPQSDFPLCWHKKYCDEKREMDEIVVGKKKLVSKA